MRKGYTRAELRQVSITELEELHDKCSEYGGRENLQTIRDELRHREQAKQTSTIRRLTWCMAILTMVITLTTIANVILWAIK